MKHYLVYVNGVEQPEPIKAGSHNVAEKKAQKKYPNQNVQVAYTEI